MQVQLQVARNFASRVLNSGVKALGGVVLVPFLIAKLGMAGYGLVVVIGVAVGLSTVADFGLRPALSRHLAAGIAVRDWAAASRLYSTAATIYLLIAFPVALGFSLATPLLLAVAKVPPELQAGAGLIFRWYVPYVIVFSFLMPLAGAPLAALNRFDIRNRLDTLIWGLSTVGLFAVLGLTSLRLEGWALTNVVASLAYLVSLWRASRAVCPEVRLRWLTLAAEDFRLLFETGKFLFAAQIVRQLKFQLDPIVLTGFYGVGSVATYRPGVSLASYARTFGSAFAGQLDALATRFHALHEGEKLGRLMRDGSRLNVLCGMPIVLVLVVFAHPIMRVWLGGPSALGENYRVAALVLMCMATVEFLYFAEGMVWPVLMGMNRIQFMVKLDVCFAMLNMVLSVLLVAFSPLGIVGVVVPSLLCELIARPIFVVHTLRVCRLPVRRYIREVYAGPGLALMVLGIPAVALRWAVNPATLPALVGCVGLVMMCWAFYVWQVGLNASERARLTMVAARMLPSR